METGRFVCVHVSVQRDMLNKLQISRLDVVIEDEVV